MSIVSSPTPLDSLHLHFYTDASNWGYAAVLGSRWFQPPWDESGLLYYHISIKEFFPIYLALLTWGDGIRNSTLTFHCDDQVIVEVIHNVTTRDPKLLMILRVLTLFTLRVNISVVAVHHPGYLNAAADHLSCHQATPDHLRAEGLDRLPSDALHHKQKSILL